MDNDLENGIPRDDEDEQRSRRIAAPGIATPSASIPAVAARALPAVSPETSARTAADESELNRLNTTGTGISQIKNPWARGALRGLNIAGEIAGAVAPEFNTALRAIPGTEEHHNVLLKRQQGRLGEDLGNEQREAATGLTGAQTEAEQAKAEAERATAAAAGQPKPKEEKWSAFTGYTDSDGTPLIHEENSGQVVRASDKKPPTGYKLAQPKPEKPDNPEQQLIDAESAVTAAKTPEEKAAAQTKLDQLKKSIADYAAAGQKPEKPGAGNARSDKSYTYNNNKLDTLAKPIEDAQARMGRLRETLAAGTPQADALVAPELLTIMAGGAGSGLRMNEAEISRIVGGRSKWESLKASINQWQLDPTKANSITPEQRQEIRGLVDAVNGKLTKKQQAIDQAREGLLDSDDPKEHRRIVTGAHHALTQVDEQVPGGGGNQNAPAAGTVEGGYKFKGGDPADKNNWEPVTKQ